MQLQTVEEATVQENQAARQKLQGVATPQSEASAPAPDAEVSRTQEPPVGPKLMPGEAVVAKLPIDEQLEERFPRAEEHTAFVNLTIEIALDSLAQAWALRRLRDRYAPEEVARLSNGSRQTLELLIRDDVSALRRRIDEARQLISPLLPREAAELVSPLVNSDAPLSAVKPVGDWRDAVTEIFPEVQKMHKSIAAVFAQPGLAAPDRQACVSDLQLVLARLDMLLPLLHRQVSGLFLSERQEVREGTSK
ncbi:MAG: hypothetical protein HY648_13560 [Acidobacteria bacterium]|nr:hypothetical protein [Acidobacteriota bacterium]